MLTRPRKHPRALSQRDSGIDGSFPRPVAVEARRSRSPNVADQVAIMEGRVGKEGVPQSLVGTMQGILCGFPSKNLMWFASRRIKMVGNHHPAFLLIPRHNSVNSRLLTVSPNLYFDRQGVPPIICEGDNQMLLGCQHHRPHSLFQQRRHLDTGVSIPCS
jgi:hypothetical protein